jgi:hypothetical protein
MCTTRANVVEIAGQWRWAPRHAGKHGARTPISRYPEESSAAYDHPPSSKEDREMDKKAKTPKKPKQNKPKDAAKGK